MDQISVQAVPRIAAFISIPKNASKSVLGILQLGQNRNTENTESLVIYENHQRGKVLNERFSLSDLFVFCFVRNPYDRCVSWFEYHKDLPAYSGLDFSTWVNSGMPHHWGKQNKTDYVNEGISPLLQYNFVEGCKLDFIGRMEQFNEGLQLVINRLNLLCKEKNIQHQFQYSAQQLNRSSRRSDFGSYYTAAVKASVYTQLKTDFDYFGYDR